MCACLFLEPQERLERGRKGGGRGAWKSGTQLKHGIPVSLLLCPDASQSRAHVAGIIMQIMTQSTVCMWALSSQGSRDW